MCNWGDSGSWAFAAALELAQSKKDPTVIVVFLFARVAVRGLLMPWGHFAHF